MSLWSLLWKGCWRLGHNWTEDRQITLDGRWAVLAGLWMPSNHCKRCGIAGQAHNEEFADGKGWWKP